MNQAELYPSRYLTAADLDGDSVVVINGVSIEKMHDRAGKEIEKPVLILRNSKPLVLNRTNYDSIKAVLGSGETDEWTGRSVTLYTTTVFAFNEEHLVIRVRAKRANGAKPAVRQPALPVEQPIDEELLEEAPF